MSGTSITGNRAAGGAPGAQADPMAQAHAKARAYAQEKGRVYIQGGDFVIDGRTLDFIGAIAQIAGDAAKRATARLELIAQELSHISKETDAVTKWLEHLRLARPKGKPDAEFYPKDLNIYAFGEFKSEFGFDPYVRYNMLDKEIHEVVETNPFLRGVDDPSDAKNASYNQSGLLKAATKRHYFNLTQSDVDQMIEVTKSEMNRVNSRSKELNLDADRFTRTMDELNEALASLQKSYADVMLTISN